MSVNLQKGQKVELRKSNGGTLRKVMVGLGWDEVKQARGFFAPKPQDIDCDAYQQYQTQYSSRNITGQQAARYILDQNGLNNIRIEQVAGTLTDHYDPSANVIRLSNGIYGGTSTAAIGVACHEVGHALQHVTNYAPIKLRAAIVPITNIGSKLAGPLILIGFLLGALIHFFTIFAYIGIICFATCTIFQLVTLPTEFDASKRALQCIENNNLLNSNELEGAKKVLTAAALTYVAALAVSLMQLLHYILILNRRRR